MALNWSIERCANADELKEGIEWRKTDAIIWLTLVIGMDEITEDNKVEFYTRLKMYEGLSGSMFTIEGKEYFFYTQDIERRIGLSTNATRETFSAWTRRMLKLQNRDYAWRKEVVA